MRNDLERVVLPAHPMIAAVKEAPLRAGAEGAVMSGSGASVIGLVPVSASAESVRAAFERHRPEVRTHCARIVSATGATVG